MRVAVLWFPDWPAHAARLAGIPEPVAVTVGGRIYVAGAQARRAGVRRGQRVRQAQALCAGLQVVPVNEDRDGVYFEQIIRSVEEVVATVEVIRPGLIAVDMGAAGRFYGSEERATGLLLDASAQAGVDCFLGVADELSTAMIAARSSAVVPAGGSRSFLASQPVGMLTAEVSLGCDRDTVDNLADLGIRTLGQLADVGEKAVVTRFGQAGRRCFTIACGLPDRRIRTVQLPQSLAVTTHCEEPVTRIDTAAFLARSLAVQLMETLARHQFLCSHLKVQAVIGGETCERVWRTNEALTEQMVADRVRWQLEGWWTGGLTELTVDPVSVYEPQNEQLWGEHRNQKMQQVIARVQSLLGVDSVLTPIPCGGRSPVERVELVPYGEERDPTRPVEGRWWGAILPPYPASRPSPDHPAAGVVLVDTHGQPVRVDAEGLLTAAPIGLGWGSGKYVVDGWAGPWPVGYQARMQVVGHEPHDDTPHAWLLVFDGRRWQVEAIYG